MQPLGFGTAGISSMRSYGEVMQLLKAAYSEGIRHFDTAPLYGRGYSEKLLGNFAKGKRTNLFIATKFGLGNPGALSIPPRLALPLNYYRKKWRGQQPVPAHPSTAAEPGELPSRAISLQEVMSGLEGSLRRLQTDYIDFYLLHEALPAFLEPGVLDFLLTQKQKGTIRYIGVAANAHYLGKVNAPDLQSWDVLQYETGPWHEQLKNKYPDKLHFLHSALKNIRDGHEAPSIPVDDRGGFLLARHTKNNPSGKMLFSTRRKKVLHNNLVAFKKYSS